MYCTVKGKLYKNQFHTVQNGVVQHVYASLKKLLSAIHPVYTWCK